MIDVRELRIQPLVVPLRSHLHRLASVTDKMFHKVRFSVTFRARIRTPNA
jgi:hypothetical protein